MPRLKDLLASRGADRSPAPSADLLATCRFRLAPALWETSVDRHRAVELAEQALAGYREYGSRSENEAAEVAAWLAEHRF